MVTRAGSDAGDGNAFDDYTRDPNDTSDADAFHGTPIEVNDVFRASQLSLMQTIHFKKLTLIHLL